MEKTNVLLFDQLNVNYCNEKRTAHSFTASSGNSWSGGKRHVLCVNADGTYRSSFHKGDKTNKQTIHA